MAVLRKIRIGTDITLGITVMASGHAVDWNSQDIKHVYAFSDIQGQPVAEMSYEQRGSTLRCVFHAEDQNYVGAYRVIIEFNDGSAFSSTLDMPALEIVRTSEEADIDTGEIVLDIDGSMRFYSLAEVISKLEGLHTEVKAAASAAREASDNANAAAKKANDAAALANSNASKAEASNKVINDNERKRIAQETARESAEADRKRAELERQKGDESIANKEAERERNEEARETNEQTREENELERRNAESARDRAESQRASSETKRISNETSRQAAENKRAAAETSRQEAETARVNVESERVTEFARLKKESEEATKAASAVSDVVAQHTTEIAKHAVKFTELESKVGDFNIEGSVTGSTSNDQYINLVENSTRLVTNSRIYIEVLSLSDDEDGAGWRIEYNINGTSYYMLPSADNNILFPTNLVDWIQVWHKPNYGGGSIHLLLKTNIAVGTKVTEASLNNAIQSECAFNVNSLFPNDTSKEFTLEEAIVAIPEKFRKIAKLISYKTKEGVEVAAFNAFAYSSEFTNLANWSIVSSGTHDVSYHENRVVYITYNLLTSATANFSEGWSGDLQNGFSHTKGGVGDLVLSTSLSWGYYMLKVTLLSGTLALDDGLCIKVGASNYLDVYNGTSEMWCYFGGKGATNASVITLKPSPLIDFKVKIEMHKIASKDTASQRIVLSSKSISHGQMAWDNSGFWNIALGEGALSMLQNGTRNIALGHASLTNFIGGARNIGVGTFSGSLLRSGDRNIAIGADSLYMIKEAEDVISIGKSSFGQGTIEGNTQARRSVAIGTNTFKGQKAASVIEESVAVGHEAGHNSGSRNICIGAYADTYNQDVVNSVVVGYSQRASESNEVRIGNKETTTVVLGNKLLHFNSDGTVTWDYSTSKKRYTGSVGSNETYDQWLSFDGENMLYLHNRASVVINSTSNSGDTNGWIFVIKLKDMDAIYRGVSAGDELSWDKEVEYIQVYHKKGTGSGSIDFNVIASDL